MAGTAFDAGHALATFMEEARELLAQMEAILLRAEQAPCSAEELNALFRCVHTIKGSGGLFGLTEVMRFTHRVEGVLDRLRQGHLNFDNALITLLLNCHDHTARLIAAVTDGGDLPAARSDRLIGRLQAALDASPEPETGLLSGLVRDSEAEILMPAEHWHLSLRFGESVLQDGMDPLAFISYLKRYGAITRLETLTDRLPAFVEANPEYCYLDFEVSLRSGASRSDIEGTFEFVKDNAQIAILPPFGRVATFVRQVEEWGGAGRRIGQILVAGGCITADQWACLRLAMEREEPASRGLLLPIAREGVPGTSAFARTGLDCQVAPARSSQSGTVKVPTDRLDDLINSVGELVIASVATHTRIGRLEQPDLLESADSMLSLVEDVRNIALRLRMVSIGEVFSRFPRVVRDVSRELGKRIELRISGAETELDKSVVEKIGDPLMHLVRNAIGHGIESAELRRARGKPEFGTVELNACQKSGSIYIEVKDDGGGLDRERILGKAIEHGMVTPEMTLSDRDVYRLILAPGLSTAETITTLSGRGVGMDAVCSSIEALRGTLDIESTPGRGATMRLCLPLTLAIIDGFHVRVGMAHFVIPLETVVECLELPPDVAATGYLERCSEPLPYVRLRTLFGVEGPPNQRPRVVVVRSDIGWAGLAVDRIYGKCQAVIKPLGPLFAKAPAVSGTTIMGNGEVGMVLDVPALVRYCTARDRALMQYTGRGTAPPD